MSNELLEEALKPEYFKDDEVVDTSNVYQTYSTDFGGPIDFDAISNYNYNPSPLDLVSNTDYRKYETDYIDNLKYDMTPGLELIHGTDENEAMINELRQKLAAKQEWDKKVKDKGYLPALWDDFTEEAETLSKAIVSGAKTVKDITTGVVEEATEYVESNPIDAAINLASIHPYIRAGKYSRLVGKTAWDWVNPFSKTRKIDYTLWPTIRPNALTNFPTPFQFPANLLRHGFNIKMFDEFAKHTMGVVQERALPYLSSKAPDSWLLNKWIGKNMIEHFRSETTHDIPYFIPDNEVRELYRNNYLDWHQKHDNYQPGEFLDNKTQEFYNTLEKLFEYGEKKYGLNFPVFAVKEGESSTAITVFGGLGRSDRIFIGSEFGNSSKGEKSVGGALKDAGFFGHSGYINAALEEYIHSVKGHQMILPGQTSALFLQIVKDMSVTGLETYHEMDAQYQEDYYGAESIHHLFGDELAQILITGVTKGDKEMQRAFDKWYNKVGAIQHEAFNLEGILDKPFEFKGETPNYPEQIWQSLWDVFDKED